MNCDGVANLLSAYLDGELSPGELLRVEEHLRRCHACADEVDSLRQTVALVASLEEVEVPASFQVSLHERLVALGPPPAAIRRAPAATAHQRNVRRWAVPAAAAAAVAALAIGVSQLPAGTQLADGLRPVTGIFSLPGDQNPSSTTDPITPPVAVNPTTKEQTVAVNVNQQPITGSKDVAQPPVTTTAADPGPTNGLGGAQTATATTGEVPPKVTNLAPQMAYSFTVAVAGALDPKVKDTLWFEYPVREMVNNDVVIKVPATQDLMDKTQKRLTELFPGAVVTPTSQNRAAELESAKLTADQALKVYQDDQMLKESDEKLAADKAAAEKAAEYYKLLQSQVSTAVFTIQFQPAH